jgi:hypothetical protein
MHSAHTGCHLVSVLYILYFLSESQGLALYQYWINLSFHKLVNVVWLCKDILPINSVACIGFSIDSWDNTLILQWLSLVYMGCRTVTVVFCYLQLVSKHHANVACSCNTVTSKMDTTPKWGKIKELNNIIIIRYLEASNFYRLPEQRVTDREYLVHHIQFWL